MPDSAAVQEVIAYAQPEGGLAVAIVETVAVFTAPQRQGPSGPKGDKGDPGPAGTIGDQLVEEFPITDPVPAEVTLANAPVLSTVGLYINGLRQRGDAYSITGQTVTLPAELLLMAGDAVLIEYVYEV